MAHVGNVYGTATMDPTGYTAGLRQMAQETYRFQQSIQSGSYGVASMGGTATRTAAHMNTLNRSIYASMTAFYMLSRQITGSMTAYEEYDNVVARIGSTADMSTSSVLGLSEALKDVNRQMAGSRTDMMKGMYRAVQAGFTSPSEFVPIAESAMRLRTASGREINTTKSADAISVIRNALGVKAGREGFITDMLLRGRDVGRYELNEMTAALGIPLTIYGNQYSEKIGAEETLRQVVTLLSATTKAGLSPNRAATGIRRMLEKTLRLGGKPEGIGENLTQGLQGLGYANVYEALDEGMIPYMRTLLSLTGGGSSEGLTKMGFGSREMMVTAAALSRGMSLTDPIYQKLHSSEIAGTTQKYIGEQQESWWYQRERLRSAYLDTQLSIMEGMLPTMRSFATSIEVLNDLFQSLSPAVRNLLGILVLGGAGKLMKNFFFRPQDGFAGKGGKAGFGVPSAGAMAGVGPYAGREASLGLTYGKDPKRIPFRKTRTANSTMVQTNVAPDKAIINAAVNSITTLPQGVRRIPNTGRSAGTHPYLYQGANGRFVSPDPSWYNKRPFGQPLNNFVGSGVAGLDHWRAIPKGYRPPKSGHRFGQTQRIPVFDIPTFDPSAYVPKTAPQSAFSRNMGNAWKFTWAGQAGRDAMISNFYNSRIEGRQASYDTSVKNLYSQSQSVYKKAVAGGMLPERAAAMSGNALAESIKKLDVSMKSANRTTGFWASGMSKLSGAMNAVGSIANMAAIGMLFQHILAFVEGLKYSKGGVKTGGVVDLSNAGKTHEQKNMFVRAWEESLYGSKILGVMHSDDPRGNIADLHRKEMERRGYVLRSDSFEDSGVLGLTKGQWRKTKGVGGAVFRKPSVSEVMNPLEYFKNSFVGLKGLNTDFRKMTHDDLLQKLLMEEFSQTEKGSFYRGTYKKTPKEIRAGIEKYAESGEMGFKAKGIFADDFLQRTNVHGTMSGPDVRKMATEGYIKAIIENTEAQNKNTDAVKSVKTIDPNAYTGVNLSFMEKLRGAAAPNKYLANKFWRDAKDEGLSKEDYNKRLRKQFKEGGFLPDETITGTMEPSGSFEHQLETHLADLGFEKYLKPGESIYEFLARTKTWSISDFEKTGGVVTSSENKKGAQDFRSLMGTAALAEALPKLGSYNETDIQELIGKIVGEKATQNEDFMASATSQFNKLDVSKFATLEESGKFFTNEVQKYSQADVYGTAGGYNAMMPYWAEQGDAQKEMNIKLDDIITFVKELLAAAIKTADHTELTAGANTGSVEEATE